jgi:hypothetical protein
MPNRSIDDLFEWLDRPAERPVHPAALPEQTLLAQCQLEHKTSGGPGGQHRNRNKNAVWLTHTPTNLHAHSAEHRYTEDNKRAAIRRLRLELAVQHRVAVPAGEIRSVLWRSRTKSGRIVLSPKHHDFPVMLAEALDVLDACDYDPRKAASRLGVSPTQLIRMIADHPPALVMVNSQRAKHGDHELRS